jgi:succinate-semialdehyde dehydrogenase/glutarate-semialdehyde dehydrogenase
VQRAAEVAVAARCQNNGQSCIAAKRFVVHADAYQEFTEAFVAGMAALRVGDPMDPATDVGPLATRQGRDDVADQVDDAVRNGARLLCGGVAPDRPGWWYPPTVLTGVTDRMRVWSEEVFGPVATVYQVESVDEALALANATPFGLGASVWSRDEDECRHLTAGLDAGMIFVNGMVASYPQLPFGGVKRSGFGRELSAHGIREFCNITTVWQAP